MTPDIRAALRDKLAAAFDAAWEASGEGFNGEYTRPGFTSEMYKRMRSEAIGKILADAPPTVAELLPLVDATHSVWWLSSSGEKRAKLHGSTIVFEWRKPHPWLEPWQPSELERSDMICIATLVEVAP